MTTTTPSRLGRFGRRLLTFVVAIIVLGATGVIALVVIGTQVGFYRSEMHTQKVNFGDLNLPELDLPVLTPVATESITWVCTLMAVVLIVFNRRAGKWMRAMWLFASISALVNWVHATVLNGDLLGGVVTGGLSIALPYTVHLFVLWVRQLKSGRTIEEERIETEVRWATIARALRTVALLLLDHLVHPLTALRTIWVWRAYRGIAYSDAWFIASVPLREGVQSVYGARTTKPVQTPPETPVRDTPEHSCTEVPEDAPHGAVLTAVRADDTSVRTEVEAFVEALNATASVDDLVQAWSDATRAHDATSENTSERTHHTDTTARAAEAPSKPRAKRAQKAKRTGSKGRGVAPKGTVRTPSAREQIRTEYKRRMSAGETTDPNAVDFAALAREFGTSRTTVSKTWWDCDKAHQDPTNRK